MKIRHIIFSISLLVVVSTVHATDSLQTWNATIYAQGQNLGGVAYQEVIIGTGRVADTLPSPPLPVEYSVSLELTNKDWRMLSRDIRPIGKKEYAWIIAVNPHGNIMPPVPRSMNLSWFPFQLGSGRFELREGHDGSGETVVPDMKTVSYYKVTGANQVEYYTIIYKPNEKR